MRNDALKPVEWLGSSLKDLTDFPREVRRAMGQALDTVQRGAMPESAKPLKGFSGISVMELVEDHRGDAYRSVYTVRFSDTVYVLHCFQKKSKRGVATPKAEMDLIQSRLKMAREHHEARLNNEQKG